MVVLNRTSDPGVRQAYRTGCWTEISTANLNGVCYPVIPDADGQYFAPPNFYLSVEEFCRAGCCFCMLLMNSNFIGF